MRENAKKTHGGRVIKPIIKTSLLGTPSDSKEILLLGKSVSSVKNL